MEPVGNVFQSLIDCWIFQIEPLGVWNFGWLSNKHSRRRSNVCRETASRASSWLRFFNNVLCRSVTMLILKSNMNTMSSGPVAAVVYHGRAVGLSLHYMIVSDAFIAIKLRSKKFHERPVHRAHIQPGAQLRCTVHRHDVSTNHLESAEIAAYIEIL